MTVNAARYRTIRVNGRVDTMPALKAASLVSRGLAAYAPDEKPRRRGRPKGSKNKPKPVSAEAVYAHPDVPIQDSSLPSPAPSGNEADTAGNKPPLTE